MSKVGMKRVVSGLILCCMLLSGWPAPAAAGAEHDALRIKWKELLVGDTSYNTSDPDIASRITSITTAAQANWNTLQKFADRTQCICLWTDLTSTTNSSHITESYTRLRNMALAYATRGSYLEGNSNLRIDIAAALDWMYANRYYPRAQYDNWFDWEIGAPLRLNDIVILMYNDLNSVQRANYMGAVHHFTPQVNDTGANRVWKAIVVALKGVILADGSQIAHARDGLSQVFDYVTSSDGFYEDGSFIQHYNHPYNGAYGLFLLKEISQLLYLLDGSSWEPTDPDRSHLYEWVYNAFEPLIYKGAMMDMVRGRDISRHTSSDHHYGRSAARAVLRISQFAPPADAAAFRSMVKYWIGVDTTTPSFYEGGTISEIAAAKAIMSNTSITPRVPLTLHKTYRNMDRVVHLRPDFGFGLSMYSSRVYNYESINNENLKGWYTGSGMTYLYNNDLEQYKDQFWPTVNAYRLPGTTVKRNVASSSWKFGNGWVGGADLQNLFGAAGMSVTENNLHARKSWFMFDDEIVALGSAITAAQGNEMVETIVENRRLTASGNNAFTVNGVPQSASLTQGEQTYNGVNWAHLSGNVAGSDIGYYFPGGASINAIREARTGSWSQINQNSQFINATPVTRNYLTMWLNHGSLPANQSYSYVLLPNKTSAQVSGYAANPNIAVLENSADAHAVKENTLNIIGANFWLDQVKSISVSANYPNFLTSNKKASVMLRETGTEIELAVADPTQLNTGTIEIEVKKSASGVISKSPEVTVIQLSPSIKVSVNVNNAKGQTFVIKLNK